MDIVFIKLPKEFNNIKLIIDKSNKIIYQNKNSIITNEDFPYSIKLTSSIFLVYSH